MKRILPAFLCVVMCTVLAFAHSGRTDGDGGHYDHSSGEYHYHHGYPAHQHEDGVCPYGFDNQTRHNSGGGGKAAQSENREPTEKGAGGRVLLLAALSPIAVTPLAMAVWRLQYLRARKKYRELYEGKSLSALAGVPDDVWFDADGTPHMRCLTDRDKFTVYATASGKRYHTFWCKNARNGIAMDVCSAQDRGLTPCRRCEPIAKAPDWLREYRRLETIQRQYRIEMLP